MKRKADLALRRAMRDAKQAMKSLSFGWVEAPDEQEQTIDQAMERVVDRWRWNEARNKDEAFDDWMYGLAATAVAYLEGIEAEMKGTTE